MRKISRAQVVMFLFLVSLVRESFASEIVWEEISKEKVNLSVVSVCADNPRIIYAGLKGGILKSEDSANTWIPFFSVGGQNNSVNFLVFAPIDTAVLFAGTGKGLYCSRNQGKNWRRIFKGKNYLEGECLALAITPLGICLGTKGGLFVATKDGSNWQKVTAGIGDNPILSISCNPSQPNNIYAASDEDVFMSDDGGRRWDKIFTARMAGEDSQSEEAGEISAEAEEDTPAGIRFLRQAPNNADCVYVATGRGVYKSQNKGISWQSISNYGLLSQDVRFLLLSNQSQLFAATKSGIFEYRGSRWHELSVRLITEKVNFLDLDSRGNLYAACDNGLFRANIGAGADNRSGYKQESAMEIYYKDEPKISDIQNAAIKYAEVEPEKILRWRRQAAKRAILPKVTISADRDRNRTIASSIWGIYGNGTSPGRYFAGPDDETRYKNNNWSVSLTWELGDLIFSDNQANIDVRSRLMVQLRDDVLDEVTKLYFERIRVKAELNNLSIEDRKKRFDNELKLQELTAQLDGLTGGYFSSRIKEKS